MSLYFFSSECGKIGALVGIKAIVLPYKDLYDRLRDLASKERRDPKDLVTELRSVLARDDLPGILVEELNHFRCISQSRVASFFHLRQFLVRIAFSEAIRRQLQREEVKRCRAFLGVVKYWTDYAQFHYVAMPWIEAQHLFVTGAEGEGIASPFYESRIADALHSLLATQIGRDESFLHVSRRIDALYGSLRKIGLQQFAGQPGHIACLPPKKYEKAGVRLALIETISSLFTIHAWPRLIYIVVDNFYAIVPYLISRFRLGGGASDRMAVGMLPAFISGDLTIDPIAFASGRSCLPSQEVLFNHCGDESRRKLLWHILSRLAVARVLTSVGVDIDHVLSYFSELRRFHEEWAPNAAAAMNIVSELDFEIAIALEDAFVSAAGSRNEELEKLVSLGLSLFQRFSAEERAALFDDADSRLLIALNCTYMHI